MTETRTIHLSGVLESLLITLYLRAQETCRSDALLKDESAVELVKRISNAGLYDFDRINSLHLSAANKLVIILRNREFDRLTLDFLRRHADAVVVHIGCGLDTRFERLAERNSLAAWFDLDLPEVIALRRQLIGDERDRYHLLSCSVLEDSWLEIVQAYRHRPFLFLAEGVFMYLESEQVKSLVLALSDRFPGSELVFDAYSPIHVWRHNLQTSTSKISFPTHWGIWHGQELEKWGHCLRLLSEWGFFDTNEPRLAPIRWLRFIESLARTFRIYHFQLGGASA